MNRIGFRIVTNTLITPLSLSLSLSLSLFLSLESQHIIMYLSTYLVERERDKTETQRILKKKRRRKQKAEGRRRRRRNNTSYAAEQQADALAHEHILVNS